jgi:hypothetical protein
MARFRMLTFMDCCDGNGRMNRELEQNLEAFLREMAIMGEHIRDLALAHRHYRDAVRQAVAFVASSLIQIKTTQERLSRLRQHLNTCVLHRLLEHSDNNAALSFTGTREVVEKFTWNFIRSYQSRLCIRKIEGACRVM